MSIFITGDTHGQIEINKISNKFWKESKNLTEEDSLIILGDFGLIFNNIQTNEEKFWLDWLEEKKYKIYFIDGNHDNHSKIWEYPTCGKFRKIRENLFYIPRGTCFELEGITFLAIGGAASHDKYHRKENFDWWQTELLSKKEEDSILDLLDLKNNFDIILSHTAPSSMVDFMSKNNLIETYDYICSIAGYNSPKRNRFYCPVSNFLEHVKNNSNFKRWYFGHFHIDKDFVDECGNEFVCVYNEILEVRLE